MPVEVSPQEFSLVFFDSREIRALTERLSAEIGLPPDAAITVEVDETTPMGHSELSSMDPIHLKLESGALEDPKRPRHLNPVGAADVLGRLLFEALDRAAPTFGDPPGAEDMTLPHAVAWQVYCVGRLGRLGHEVQRQRRLYHFRNRHGFNDAADAAFDRLWSGRDLSWADIVAISDSAEAPVPV